MLFHNSDTSFKLSNCHILEISSPNVPDDVANEATPEGQVAKMKEWFLAFQNGDTSSGKDLYAHFKPVLSYVEGTWKDESAFQNEAQVNLLFLISMNKNLIEQEIVLI